MNLEKMKETAARLLQLSAQEAEEYGEYLPEEKAFFLSVPVKGGASLLVAEDGSVLYANSSVSFDVHLREFKNGRRTPLEAFGEQ